MSDESFVFSPKLVDDPAARHAGIYIEKSSTHGQLHHLVDAQGVEAVYESKEIGKPTISNIYRGWVNPNQLQEVDQVCREMEMTIITAHGDLSLPEVWTHKTVCKLLDKGLLFIGPQLEEFYLTVSRENLSLREPRLHKL
jgi:hypothetical protein